MITDSSASGGKFVTREKAGNGLVLVPLSSSAKAPFIVWVRYRGVAVELKGVDSKGTQSELNWLWDRPSTFRRASFGAHSLREIGNKILVIGGPNWPEKSGVDVVVMTADPDFNPYTADLKPTTPPVDAIPNDIHLDWEKTTGQRN